ncbi:helix-turn-helix transcriptional regulator [Roseobacter sp.]|uniref:helix-turn-helix transcriptional regulator n=1 Tax=Roseobacter sp. TaxID=1907202 RepID=UPI003858366C
MMEIQELLYWEHLGIAGAVAVSAFVLLGLFLRLHETPTSRMHIWAMIAFFVNTIADAVNSFAYSGVFLVQSTFFRWHDVFVPGFMVALYFYVRALTSSNATLHRRDAVHLLPFVMSFICLAPALVLPANVRRGLVEGAISPSYQQLIDLGEMAYWILWIAILIIYGGLCIRRLIQHKRNIRDVFSDLENKTLRWLDGLVATILILALFVIIDEVLLLMGSPAIREGVWSRLFDLVLPMSFGIFALRANPPLPDWSEQILEAPTAPEMPEPGEPQSRYARSGLQQEDIDRYAARLESRMVKGQLWRDHGLNLSSLASAISISPIHLSEVLNTKLSMPFYDYVNQCRIRDACDLLVKTDDTIIEISETVGFNAKSTFNTSFKKVTDLTPSGWRATHKPQSAVGNV